MHLKYLSKSFKKALYKYMFNAYPAYVERRKLEDKAKEKEEEREKDKEDRSRLERQGVVPEDKPKREQTSEERRAMIASWNNEKERD